MPKVLVTGGAGYIGSQTVYHLLRNGYEVTVVDDLSRGYRHNVEPARLKELNLSDTDTLTRLCEQENFDAVIHFAAFIAVGESTRKPELYFTNNVGATLSLLTAMQAASVRRLSSPRRPQFTVCPRGALYRRTSCTRPSVLTASLS